MYRISRVIKIKSPLQKSDHIADIQLNTADTVAVRRHSKKSVCHLIALAAAIITPALFYIALHKRRQVICRADRVLDKSVIVKLYIA